MIGKETTLIDDISLDNAGAVKINGVVWTAIAEADNIAISAGTLVVITEIRGNKLIVREKGD